MKLSRLTLAFALAASCGLATAQTAPAPAPAAHVHPTGATPAAAPMPGRGMMGMGSPEQHKMKMDQMFAAADANKDGSISRAEFDAHHAAMRGGQGGPGAMQHGGMMHQGMKPGAGNMGHCMPMDATPQADDEPKADAGK